MITAILWCYSFFLLFVPVHALYISTTTISHFEETSIMKVETKVFVDDIEAALKNAKLETKNIPSLEVYYKEHLVITINKMPMELTYKSHEEIGDTYQIVFEAVCPSQWQTIRIETDLLLELFPTQTNVVSCKNGSSRQFCRLSANNTSCSLAYIESFGE